MVSTANEELLLLLLLLLLPHGLVGLPVLECVLDSTPFKMGEFPTVAWRAGDGGEGTEFHWSKMFVGTALVSFRAVYQELNKILVVQHCYKYNLELISHRRRRRSIQVRPK